MKKSFSLLIIYEVAVGYISLLLHFNALQYLSVSWALPAIFFIFHLKTKKRVGYLFEALLWSIPGSLLIDWIGHYSRVWSYWGNPFFASTGLKIATIPIESFIWGALCWLFYVAVYEYFFDTSRRPSFGYKEKLLAFSITILSIVLIFLIRRYEPTIPYFYLMILAFAMFITVVSLAPYRKLVPRSLGFGLATFGIGLIVEFFSLAMGLWTFPPGHSILDIVIAGYNVPVEEILWWLVIPIGIASVHEVFADNAK
jgi:hypothetical protein